MFTRVGGATAVVGAACIAGVGAHAAVAPSTVTLAGSEAPMTGLKAVAGRVAGGKKLSIQVWLAPDLSAAESYANAASTPGNAQFRDFLTPDAYTARFGPTTTDVSAVRSWLRSQGFTALTTDAQRDYVRASAPVDRIDAAFHTAIRQYRPSAQTVATQSTLYINAQPLTVPSRLAPGIIGVTGLDDAGTTAQLGQQASAKDSQADPYPPINPGSCSHYWGQYTASGLPRVLGTTSFPAAPCGYTGHQLRSAYGANMANTGKRQTIAIALPGGLEANMFQTLKDFAKENHLPAPSPARYQELNLQPTSCTTRDTSRGEEQMDIEASYAMAPGANQIAVGGNVCDKADQGARADFNTDLAIINGNGTEPLATVVSDSDAYGYDNQAKSLDEIQNAVLVKAAAVGVGMYYAAGDTACVAQPASSPYATDVGGTSLAISKSGKRLFETGSGIAGSLLKNREWTSPKYFGLGGGQSLLYQQPAYQKGVVPASMSTPPINGEPPGQAGCQYGTGSEPAKGTEPMRTAPDTSASSDNMSVGLLYQGKYVHIADANTSLSAPLVAGMVVAAQQSQSKPFGFINPALYKLAGSNAFYDPRPLSSKDPLSWRATVCLKSFDSCGATALWRLDDESRSTKGYSGQVTRKGYDTTTGLGVPNGQAFINAMRQLG
jgi:subtilase family serine protease